MNTAFRILDFDTRKKYKGNSKIDEYINCLGGKENIESMDTCMTRIRVGLRSELLMDKKGLKKLGAVGIIKYCNKINIVIGLDAMWIGEEIEKKIGL